MFLLRYKHITLGLISAFVILLFYHVSREGEIAEERVVQMTGNKHHEYVHGRKMGKLKRILYWNDFYGSKNFGFCCGRGPYLKHNCPNSQCYTSKDRREDLESFDAIVFHSRSLNRHDIPQVR